MLCLLLPPDPAAAQSLPSLGGDKKESSQSDSGQPRVVEIDGEALQELYSEWLGKLEEIDTAVATLEKNPAQTEATVERVVGRIGRVVEEARAIADDAEAKMSEPERALIAIGPPAMDNEPPEATIIAEERKRHQRHLAALNAQLTYVRLINARADELLKKLALLSETRLVDWILTKDDPASLLDKGPGTADIAILLGSMDPLRLELGVLMTSTWFTWLALLAVTVVAGMIVWMARATGLHGYGGRPAQCADERKLAIIRVVQALGRGILPAILCGSLASLMIALTPLMDLPWVTAGACMLIGLGIYFWLFPIIHIAFSSTDAKARFSPRSDDAARRLRRLLQGLCILIAVFFGAYLVVQLARRTPEQLLLALQLFAVFAFAAYAVYVACLPLFGDPEGRRQRRWSNLLRLGLAALAMGCVTAALFGYVNFSAFVIVHIAGSLLLVVATYFIRPILHEGLRALFSNDSATFRQTERSFTETCSHIVLDLTVVTSFVLLLLGFWSVPLDVLWLWLRQTGTNFTVGEFRLGADDFVVAVLVFVVIFLLMRLARNLLRHKILERMSIDCGLRDSIDTVLRYAGFVIAIAAAIVMLGIDLTSFAVLFGALLLGVGFGLQNTVDNFVSGLILLIQRPIKSGDWIRVKEHEGFVQRIGVVSTEISKFEEASVIIPNSDLVSSAVVNRTHGLTRGRVDVPVDVVYDSDVTKVLEILRSCATENENVLSEPGPDVVLLGFSDSSLNFELRAFIPNISDLFATATELRIAILEQFRTQGIEIPFPQRDLHLRSANEPLRMATAEQENQDHSSSRD